MSRFIASAALIAGSAWAIPGVTNRAGHTVVGEPLPERRHLADDKEEEPNPYTCSEGVKTAAEDWKVTGTNLGGWLVLEPWITPSLFYQFLSTDETWGADAPAHTGMDSYTFCEALGPEEGNKQMRRHWKAWVRDEDIATIAKSGATHVRIPVGDWMYEPYGPYVGCMDGALEELDRVLDLCKKYKIGALLDVHALKGSQNGFDNSGQAADLKWTATTAQGLDAYTTFEHWPIRAAHWPGHFDLETLSYPKVDDALVSHALRVIENIVKRHKTHTAVWGVEPVNEPWQFIPLEPLKKYYWDAYHIVRAGAPQWRFVMHDSFRGYPAAWWDFMKGCPMKALDTHIYQAWNRPGVIQTYYNNACNFKGGVRVMEDLVDMPIIVGEWSLATDNCAMWLNGFNDNLPGYPKVSCRMFPCAEPYMGYEQPGCPPSDEMPLQGPYGTGVSGPQFGQCPVGVEWGAREDEYMTSLTMKHLHSFNSGHGWFFWNFRTEIEPRWSFNEAWYKGWFPGNVSDFSAGEVTSACSEKPMVQANAVPRATTTLLATSTASANGVTTAAGPSLGAVFVLAALCALAIVAVVLVRHPDASSVAEWSQRVLSSVGGRMNGQAGAMGLAPSPEDGDECSTSYRYVGSQ